MAAVKRRADVLLVERGFFDSRAKARAAIEAGAVRIAGKTVAKPSETFEVDAEIAAEPAHPWVSRAGVKLAHGLDVFGVDVSGKRCLDIGASTGGFTQVLLSRGAARVVAVDVGRGQLAPAVRADPRVAAREETDARALTRADVGEPPDIVVCDASFIGLEKVLGRALDLAGPEAEAVVLFKPQFEVGPEAVGKGGIVRDRQAAEAARARVAAWLTAKGWSVAAAADSPITGGDGNVETLLHLKRT